VNETEKKFHVAARLELLVVRDQLPRNLVDLASSLVNLSSHSSLEPTVLCCWIDGELGQLRGRVASKAPGLVSLSQIQLWVYHTLKLVAEIAQL
jgi:hypothetical protein